MTHARDITKKGILKLLEDGTREVRCVFNDSDEAALYMQEGDQIVDVETYKNEGIYRYSDGGIYQLPPVSGTKQYDLVDGRWIDVRVPVDAGEIILFQEKQQRRVIYEQSDAETIKIVQKQILATGSEELIEKFNLFPFLPDKEKREMIPRLIDALVLLPEEAKTTEFKELEKRRAEIRAQTAIRIEESV